MKIRKKIMIPLTIIILIIGILGGYMIKKNSKPKGPEEIKDRIISFLDKKYGKEFVAISLIENDWQNVNNELRVYPKGGDKDKDVFSAFGQMEDGKYTIYDTYVCQLIRDEYKDRVEKIAEEFFPQCKVDIIFISESFPNNFGINTKLQDIIDAGSNVKYNPKILIMVNPTLGSIDEFNKNVDLFAQKMAVSKLQGSPIIYYLKKANLNLTFDDMNIDTYQKRSAIYIDQEFSVKNR